MADVHEVWGEFHDREYYLKERRQQLRVKYNMDFDKELKERLLQEDDYTVQYVDSHGKVYRWHLIERRWN
jgi:hypothetical protein